MEREAQKRGHRQSLWEEALVKNEFALPPPDFWLVIPTHLGNLVGLRRKAGARYRRHAPPLLREWS